MALQEIRVTKTTAPAFRRLAKRLGFEAFIEYPYTSRVQKTTRGGARAAKSRICLGSAVPIRRSFAPQLERVPISLIRHKSITVALTRKGEGTSDATVSSLYLDSRSHQPCLAPLRK